MLPASYLEIARVGFIFGVGGGSGTLVFRGRRYPLSVGGLSVGATIGASKADLVGRACNLRRASDIAGTYAAVNAGAAVAGGGSGIRLQGAKGVVLDLRGRNIGLEFNVSVSGVRSACAEAAPSRDAGLHRRPIASGADAGTWRLLGRHGGSLSLALCRRLRADLGEQRPDLRDPFLAKRIFILVNGRSRPAQTEEAIEQRLHGRFPLRPSRNF